MRRHDIATGSPGGPSVGVARAALHSSHDDDAGVAGRGLAKRSEAAA
jgi:hypothetical protein